MSDLTFAQPERRNYLVPGVIVVVLVALAAGLIYRYTPHRIADLAVTHTAILPVHTEFSSGSHLVGAQTVSEDDLYVLVTVRIQDDLRLPLFIKDLTGSLTSADGSVSTSSAIEKNDIPGLLGTFPALKPLASAPLYRETTIQPGQSAEGMVLLHFPLPRSAWDQRQAASVTVGTYSQGPLTVAIPK